MKETLNYIQKHHPYWNEVVPKEVDPTQVLRYVYLEKGLPSDINKTPFLSYEARPDFRIALVTNPGNQVICLRQGQKIAQALRELPEERKVEKIIFFKRKGKGGILWEYPGSVILF